jgi:hypothetical protein
VVPAVPPAASTASGSVPADAAGAPSTPPGDGLDRDDLTGWAVLLGQLYARRSGAYATTDPTWLSGVYTTDSDLLVSDRDQVTGLAANGETVVGFTPTVRQVIAVSGDDRSVVVALVDEVPAHRVVPVGEPGGPGREVTGRAAAEVRMTLRRTGEGWRIVSAARQD